MRSVNMCNDMKITVVFAFILVYVSADYWTNRNAFIRKEESKMIGSTIELNYNETLANDIFMRVKLAEYDAGFKNPSAFTAAQHFFYARPDIEKSKVFEFIQRLPKGASLHTHDTSMASGEFVYNLTHRDNLYGCTVNQRLCLRFFKEPVQNSSCNWILISTLRQTNSTYDAWLKSQLTLEVPDPRQTYTNINTVWAALEHSFTTVIGMLTYMPVFEDYFYKALEESYMDNVMYVEFRTTLPQLYDLTSTTYGPLDVVRCYKETLEKFKIAHPDFEGARFIYAPYRNASNITMSRYIETAKILKRHYPDFMAGFDLVGEEDVGLPLENFVQQLQMLPKDIKLFFHAGETNWNGAATDLNLVDAVLLGTTRIGHGYAIAKHPQVMEAVKQRGIALEICPISNQVLLLVDDLRNHPGNTLIAEGFPVVIGNDDPCYWGSKGLSYDWYLAFMGMSRRNADLRLLKQLAINSVIYSAMPDEQKQVVLYRWRLRWKEFIEDVIRESF